MNNIVQRVIVIKQILTSFQCDSMSMAGWDSKIPGVGLKNESSNLQYELWILVLEFELKLDISHHSPQVVVCIEVIQGAGMSIGTNPHFFLNPCPHSYQNH